MGSLPIFDYSRPALLSDVDYCMLTLRRVEHGLRVLNSLPVRRLRTLYQGMSTEDRSIVTGLIRNIKDYASELSGTSRAAAE